ncbi:SusC/RagA family TonB-linked outer membrane protein [Pedobacter cryoconitis]|uniref:TonB-linked SusC/RagA family outer membrane protein n=1 Tax=Pedobacter cryoconitis TaxID=188932 RepID=A0A327SKU7_9SPHI|nr:TonB-dependent receptor [Pedobacter cryoconitis]RAJ29112.1 TonB-linked SusC/RagA family outer membrane protein [Pedobacter cryoconitis]
MEKCFFIHSAGNLLKRYKKRLHYGVMLGLLIILSNPVLAQNGITISGIVRESSGQPLPGAGIKIKGTTIGTVTDGSGKYIIKVPEKAAILVFSSIGFLTAEEVTGNRNTINITLSGQQNDLETVVVVGYGTQKKANLTGSVATVTGADLTKRVSTNPTQLLQGKLPGLSVTQASGEAGNEGNVLRIRGLGTYSGAGTEPLVIIDGIPGNLTVLNPESIESVTVLKDAASASIYGSRAANGVILVTTKQGKAGKMQIAYSYNLGITKASSLPDLVYNSAQYMQMYNQAAINSGAPVANRFAQAEIDLYANSTDKNRYPDYNWLNAVLRTVNVQTHNLNLSGGNETTTYNVGLGIVNQPDIMKGFEYKKYNLQLNINSKINSHVNFGASFTMNYGKRTYPRQGSQDLFIATLSQSPLYGPVLPDGSGRYTAVAYPFQSANKNPIAVAENAMASTNDYYMQGNVFVDVKIINGLQWKTSVGTNFDFKKTYDYKPVINQYLWSAGPDDLPFRVLDVGGQGLQVTDDNYIYPIGYSQLTYTKKIADHSFTILGGTQAEYYKVQSLSASRVAFPNNAVQEIDAGGTGSQLNSGKASEWAINSFYGRLNYDYKGKYLVEGNLRADGSSRFYDRNKWGLFPSVSLGYRISQESFFKSLLPVISDMKLRASVGKLGNQNIGYYPYQDVYATGFSYPFSSNLTDGVRKTNLTDQEIRWETTKIVNFGLDLSFFNNKLNFSADYYNKTTSDILGEAALPGYIGYKPPIINNGTIQNRGIELSAQYKNKIGQLGYSVSANLQANRNKLAQYSATNINTTTIEKVGLPFGSFYLYEFDKIFQSATEIAAAPKQPYNPVPGTFKFKDLNGDGKIDENDRTVVSGIFPKYDYSVTFNFDYKNFDLTVFLYGSQGQKQYVNGWGFQPFNQGSVPTTEWANAWTPENPSTTLPLIYLTGTGNVSQNLTTTSTYYLKDASFLRIKNIQLGYNLPAPWAKRAGMSAFRIYFAGENLFTFTKFPGLDPERVASNTRYLTHPQNKIYNFGVRATF